jgi:preprotein translocase subunit SecD
MSRHAWVFWICIALLVVASLIAFPINSGVLGHWGIRLGLDLQGGTRIQYSANLTGVAETERKATLESVIAVLENRINPLGVSETRVASLGVTNDQGSILVEVPGKVLTTEQKNSLGRVALLEFGELLPETDNTTPAKWTDEYGRWIPVTANISGVETELTSSFFQNNTYVQVDQNSGAIELHFNFNTEGSEMFTQITTRLLHKPLGIFEGDQPLRSSDGRPIAPTVNAVISSSGIVEGLSVKDATTLSKQLNAGRLPVPLTKLPGEQYVDPILGSDLVTKSVVAGLLGVAGIALFMVLYYRVSGLMAMFAIGYYAVLSLALFKLVGQVFGGGFTLTLAGIGGFVLSIGMAVDANVLIFERMKEEMWAGRGLGGGIEAGFNRAFSAIFDSNMTTILSGVVLYWLGSTNVIASDVAKGFAVTLIIGVVVSFFTAITVTRSFIRPFVNTGLGKNTTAFAPYQNRKKEEN